jgi:hypothetical protein
VKIYRTMRVQSPLFLTLVLVGSKFSLHTSLNLSPDKANLSPDQTPPVPTYQEVGFILEVG